MKRQILFLMCLMLLVACGTSSKVSNKISVSEYEHVGGLETDSVALHTATSISDSLKAQKTVVDSITTSLREDADEIITEHIVTETDPTGNTKRTEERTIKRNTAKELQQTQTTEQTTDFAQWYNELIKRDSLSQLRMQNYMSHWQDSINNAERNEVKSESMLQGMMPHIITSILLIILATIALCLYKKKKP